MQTGNSLSALLYVGIRGCFFQPLRRLAGASETPEKSVSGLCLWVKKRLALARLKAQGGLKGG